MKVVTAQQMSFIESMAYRDGSSEDEFMEEAGSGVALVVYDYLEEHSLPKSVILLCGKGNNGGDAYVTGIHLLHLECEVIAYQIVPIDDCSELCRSNYRRFVEEGGRVLQLDDADGLHFPPSGVIVDGIFGTGFKGEVVEPFAAIIKRANSSGLPIIAIDIPSGLDATTGIVAGEAIAATETAFLGLPKVGFFLRNGWDHVGALRYVDFGLGKNYIDRAEAPFTMLVKESVKPYLPRVKNSRHKYQAGLAVGLAGSPGMVGAAILAAMAALRGGAGIVRLLCRKEMEGELVVAPPELIKIPYVQGDLGAIVEQMNKASATFVGPALGCTDQNLQLLQQLFPLLTAPCVIDADALTLLAMGDLELPPISILTPHRGEMARLLGSEASREITPDYLDECCRYAERKRATLILKGGPTFIFDPEGKIVVNYRGGPGMATAGSGDLLTGLIAALLAQGLTAEQAACLGVYIHGIAGEYAAVEYTPYCTTASDILYRFPEGFLLSDQL